MSSLLKQRNRLIEGATIYKTKHGSIEVFYSQNQITYTTPTLTSEKRDKILALESKFPELFKKKAI